MTIRSSKMPPMVAIIVMLLSLLPLAGVRGQDIPFELCEQVIKESIRAASQRCNGLGQDQVCYGNRRVDAGLRPDPNVATVFASAGDRVTIGDVVEITSAPLNVALREWGITTMRVRAELTNADTSVVLIAFGDTMLRNPSSQMRGLLVETGFGRATCRNFNATGVLAQAPRGESAIVTINGVDIAFTQTIYVSAALNGALNVASLDGIALVTSVGRTQVVNPGFAVRVLMGGFNGLQAISEPTPAQPYSETLIPGLPLFLLPQQPLPVVLTTFEGAYFDFEAIMPLPLEVQTAPVFEQPATPNAADSPLPPPQPLLSICGNSICEAGETSESCPQDCGAPAAPVIEPTSPISLGS